MVHTKFNGKMYILIAKFQTKAEADRRAKTFRSGGKYLARVIRHTHLTGHIRIAGSRKMAPLYWLFVYKKPTGKRK